MATKKTQKSLVSKYLLYYNLIQFIGWSFLFLQIICYYTTNRQYQQRLWDFTKYTVMIFQYGALLEVLHILVGLVKGSVFVTAAQTSFRILNIVAVLSILPPKVDSIGITMTLIAWSLAETIRYLFYVFKEWKNDVPYIVMWCRYSFFLVLIPIGLSGELISLIAAQAYAAEANILAYQIPYLNITIGYRHFLLMFVPIFIRGVITVYKHMLSQRRKALSPQHKFK